MRWSDGFFGGMFSAFSASLSMEAAENFRGLKSDAARATFVLDSAFMRGKA